MSDLFEELGFVPAPAPKKVHAQKKFGSQKDWQRSAAYVAFMEWKEGREPTLTDVVADIVKTHGLELKPKTNFIGLALGKGVSGRGGADLHAPMGKILRTRDNAAKLLACVPDDIGGIADVLSDDGGGDVAADRAALFDFVRSLPGQTDDTDPTNELGEMVGGL